MNLLQDILSGQNGGVVKQIASQYGLDESQAQSAISSLVPALARGVRNNAAQGSDGLAGLIGALQNGNIDAMAEPSQLGGQQAVDQGNYFLGQIFGSKDVSRGVADRAAEQTGIGSDILKQMLPVLATAVMGSLTRNALGGGQQQGGGSALGGIGDLLGGLLGGGGAQQQSGGMGMLTQFLDADGDGSILDDVVGMLGRR